MGRWSQGEHERQLNIKIKKLFEKSLSDPLLERPEDQRFNTFIRQLDPDDKVIQACFQSLVQNMLYMNSRGSRRARASLSPPPSRRTAPRTQIMQRRSQPGLRTVPSLRRLNPEVSVTSPVTSRPTSPDFAISQPAQLASPSRARRRSPSPSFSPSRARHFENAYMNPELDSSSTFDAPREASPSLSGSRAWLEEYQQNNIQQRPSSSTSFIESIMNASYGGLPSTRRRRREEEQELRRVRRRVDPADAEEGLRDTRRDGVVFEAISPLPHSHELPPGLTGEDDHMWGGMDGFIDFLPDLGNLDELEAQDPEFI